MPEKGLFVIARRHDEAISVQEWIASFLAMTDSVWVRVIARRHDEALSTGMDCFVPRNDELRLGSRHCKEVRRSNLSTGMDCFVPRNDA
ncbi:MAG: hypothetical protein LBR81_06640 [Prevotellaceae bacterium]|nr:hypothetical protein [Prevotellaceae bacterium]